MIVLLDSEQLDLLTEILCAECKNQTLRSENAKACGDSAAVILALDRSLRVAVIAERICHSIYMQAESDQPYQQHA